MGNDLADLGSAEIFPFEPDWSREPSASMVLVRRLQQHRGTSANIEALTPWTPEKITAGFTITSRREQYDCIDFFARHRGRLKRFWFRHPAAAFDLLEDVPAGATSFFCRPNAATARWCGQERIYIERNGDLITRRITSIVDDKPNNRLILNFATQLAEPVARADCRILARLLLVRFDQDRLSIKPATPAVGTTVCRLIELPAEYEVV